MRAILEAVLARLIVAPLLGLTLTVTTLGSWGRRLRRGTKNDVSSSERRLHVTVIVTFYNANWCRAHLAPIALAANVKQVTAVVDGPTAEVPGVEYIYPPAGLTRVVGRIISKLIVLFRVAVTYRSDVIIGYFLVPNGLWALMVARLLGRFAIYQNTVGPTEIVGSGMLTDNKILSRLRWHSWILERLTFSIVRRFDAVVVRGKRGVDYLQSLQLSRRPVALVGSVDCERFSPGTADRCYDVITVARLVEIKQLHHLLEIVRCLMEHRATVSAVIVGDGPLLAELERQAVELGIAKNVAFRGQVDNVESLLQRSRVFLLTSRMEGLSIALAEAMACGVPAVVSDVGELGELVENDVTGWRVSPGDVAKFAERILELLEAPEKWHRFSLAARDRASAHSGLNSVADRWKTLLDDVVWQRCSMR